MDILKKALMRILASMPVKILIVEDESEIIAILKEHMKSIFENPQIDAASSARGGLRLMENKAYDMVISDLSLKDKDLDGCCVLKKAKDHGAFAVLCSGSGMDLRKCPDGIKPDFMLTKPFALEHIDNMVECFRKMNKWAV